MNWNVLTILAVLVLCAAGVLAQTTLNPDVSAIGDFRAFGHNDEGRADEAEQFNLADPQFELMIGGYLNPYARADAVIAWHDGHDAAIEEVYATVLRGLPLGTNLRAGKYLLEFGRLNPVHPHAFSFLQRPLPHEALLGEEGLSDMAVRASFLLPTGSAYTELMLGVLKGDALEGHSHEHEHEEEAEEEEAEETIDERRDPGFFGRLGTSLAVSEHAELALGASVVNAVYELHRHEATDPVEQMRAWLVGGDVKYKYRPSRNSAFQIETELLMRRNEQHEGDALTSYGGYGYLDYRFRQKYNLGGIFEYLRQKEMHEHEEEHHVHQADTWRVGLFTGFAPIEETSLVRLAGHWTKPEAQDGFWELTLQLVVSLGPHQPHNF